MKSNFFATTAGIVATGAVIGILAVVLQLNGNPPNMGICVACFERDMAGALGLHRAAIAPVSAPRDHRPGTRLPVRGSGFRQFQGARRVVSHYAFHARHYRRHGRTGLSGMSVARRAAPCRRGPQRPSWSGRPVHGNRRGNAVLPPGLFTRPAAVSSPR